MEKHNFVFLILHYITTTDTEKCVNSILEKYKKDNVKIVIVDNGSPNDSGKYIYDKYKKNKRIKVILSEKNLGFANGNNLGFEYAKNKLKADFIIMINNDTYLIQDDFLERIVSEYKKSKFAVLGPKQKLRDGTVNEIYEKLHSLKQYKKELRKFKYEYILSYIYLYPFYIILRKSLIKLFIFLKLKKAPAKADPNKRHENVILHGSALIFSKKYIDLFDGIDTRTFLYREEELLYLRLKNNNLINVYNPDIEIFHNEDGATDALTKNKRNKILFIRKHSIKSTKLVISELEKQQIR